MVVHVKDDNSTNMSKRYFTYFFFSQECKLNANQDNCTPSENFGDRWFKGRD